MVKIIITLLFLMLTSCSNMTTGIPGPEAKQKIMDAVIVRDAMFASSDAAYYGEDAFTLFSIYIMIDDIFVSTLTGIDESKNYTENSVNDCYNNILFRGTLLGSISCNLHTTSL